MAVVLESYLRELLRRRPVPLHVLAAGSAEERGGDRRGLEAAKLDHHVNVAVHRIDTVRVLHPERPLLHLLEAKGQNAGRDPTRYELLAEEERGRTRRAVVIDVVDGDAREPQPVNRALAGGRLPGTTPHT